MYFMTICLLLVTTTCEIWKPVPPAVTPLVRRVQNAGAGTLAGVPPKAVERWLATHPAIVREIMPQCQKIEVSAPASWNTSTEGILCAAAGDAKVLIARKDFFRYVSPSKDPTVVPSTFGDIVK